MRCLACGNAGGIAVASGDAAVVFVRAGDEFIVVIYTALSKATALAVRLE
jgi:hypothetical protein